MFPVVLHVVLQEPLHPSRFVVFPVVLHVELHVVLQELLHSSRFVVFSVYKYTVKQHKTLFTHLKPLHYCPEKKSPVQGDSACRGDSDTDSAPGHYTAARSKVQGIVLAPSSRMCGLGFGVAFGA